MRDWQNERWVKLYVRDEPEWLILPWQARGIFYELLRKVDINGVLKLGRARRKAIAIVLSTTWDENLNTMVETLLDDGAIALLEDETILYLPNFHEAQEARQSDMVRQRKRRERDRALKTALNLPSQNDHLNNLNSDPVIYFLRIGDKIRIGKTKNIASKIQKLQAENNETVELLGTQTITQQDSKEHLNKDKQLHKLFSKHRITGEIFNADEEILSYISQNTPAPSIVTPYNSTVTKRDEPVTRRDESVTKRDEPVTRRDESVTKRDTLTLGDVSKSQNDLTGETDDCIGKLPVTKRDRSVTKRDESVTKCDAKKIMSQNVTDPSRNVTKCHAERERERDLNPPTPLCVKSNVWAFFKKMHSRAEPDPEFRLETVPDWITKDGSRVKTVSARKILIEELQRAEVQLTQRQQAEFLIETGKVLMVLIRCRRLQVDFGEVKPTMLEIVRGGVEEIKISSTITDN